jgi:hypothetical protein
MERVSFPQEPAVAVCIVDVEQDGHGVEAAVHVSAPSGHEGNGNAERCGEREEAVDECKVVGIGLGYIWYILVGRGVGRGEEGPVTLTIGKIEPAFGQSASKSWLEYV